MGRLAKVLILLVCLDLSACLTPGAQTAAPTGGADSGFRSDFVPEETKAPVTETPPDETASQAGPGGMMPSGTVAPHPLVPVAVNYKAEGSYCRFEGEPSRAMVWGKMLYEGHDCLARCDGNFLQISYPYQSVDADQLQKLDTSADFRFIIDTDDPKQFGLLVVIQPSIALVGMETPPPKGFFVDVSAMQPYTVDGSPAFCPERVLMKENIGKPIPMTGPPIDLPKVMPQR